MAISLRAHWRHYAIEAVLLATFMTAAGSVAVLLALLPAHAHSVLWHHKTLQRFVFGTAMGLTAIGIIYSPWGRRSGAHFNPAVTLTYFLLGKSAASDALFYIIAQFVGGTFGFAIVARLLEPTIAEPGVHYVVTQPGALGSLVALLAETVISFITMTVVLHVSNSARYARFTGVCAGVLAATYITFEAPLSGTSLNPARTFASAFAAGDLSSIWIYFIGPPAGMLLAGLVYVAIRGSRSVRCAKLDHPATGECIFRCGYREQGEHIYA